MPVVEKRKGRPAKTPQQFAPTQVRTARGQIITLSPKDKKVFAEIARCVGDAFDYINQISNDVAEADWFQWAKNTAGLCRTLQRIKRLNRSLSATYARVYREVREL